MNRDELIDQYDRFVDQLREEVKNLYWLFNFFFVIESTFMGALFFGKLNPDYLLPVQLMGLALALYWFWIGSKQKAWRDHWYDRISLVEKELGYDEKFPIFPWDESSFLYGRRGLWRALLFLPACYALVWLVMIVGGSFLE